LRHFHCYGKRVTGPGLALVQPKNSKGVLRKVRASREFTSELRFHHERARKCLIDAE
jgi:hypothetical protein